MTLFQQEVASPFGPLTISATATAITALDWQGTDIPCPNELTQRAADQLTAYFNKELEVFDLPLAPEGGAFQQSVCNAMLEIPYGETTTYGAIAEKLGTYGQPIGHACGANTIPIIIPCHRVLGTGHLGGYSGDGGVERKIELLKHEEGFPYLL